VYDSFPLYHTHVCRRLWRDLEPHAISYTLLKQPQLRPGRSGDHAARLNIRRRRVALPELQQARHIIVLTTGEEENQGNQPDEPSFQNLPLMNSSASSHRREATPVRYRKTQSGLYACIHPRHELHVTIAFDSTASCVPTGSPKNVLGRSFAQGRLLSLLYCLCRCSLTTCTSSSCRLAICC
jgi:hypothetical protein